MVGKKRRSRGRPRKVRAIPGAQKRGTWGTHRWWRNSLRKPGTWGSPVGQETYATAGQKAGGTLGARAGDFYCRIAPSEVALIDKAERCCIEKKLKL
jgi:hypothetical protein